MKRLLALALGLLLTSAVATAATEYEIKAAFLFNFAKFTQWRPAPGETTLNICVLGNGPYRSAMQTLRGKNVHGRVLEVTALEALPVPPTCRILFVAASEAVTLDRLSEEMVRHRGLLSVSDIEGFSESGGVIEFRLIDNKLRFIVNLHAARQSDLELSSKLLRLAIAVEE